MTTLALIHGTGFLLAWALFGAIDEARRTHDFTDRLVCWKSWAKSLLWEPVVAAWLANLVGALIAYAVRKARDAHG